MPITKYGKNTPNRHKQTKNGSIPNDPITMEVKKKFVSNMTDVVTLGIEYEQIEDEKSTTRIASKIAHDRFTESTEHMNKAIDIIANDQTMTQAKKLIEKEKLVEKHMKAMDSTLAIAQRESISEFQTLSKDLFTANIALSPTDATMIGAVFAHIQENDNLTSFLRASPSEAKIALTLCKDFPTLVKTEESMEDLAREVNNKFSPGVQKKMDALKATGEALQTLSNSLVKAKGDLMNSKILTDVKNGQYNA